MQIINRHPNPTSLSHPHHPTQLRATVPVDWQRLARANTHPLRVSILEVFGIDGGRTMSSSDLAYELRAPLANVNYHVTQLAKHGLLALSHHRRVRGATEHFYRLPETTAKPGANGNGRADSRRRADNRTWEIEGALASPARTA
jgi:hypothetical protein